MNADTYLKARLAAYCIDEAHAAGGTDNMRAVAFVMRNRVAAGWGGGDWMSVLDRADDTRGTAKRQARGVDLREGTVRDFLQEIDDIYSGAAEDDLTDGALFYAELHLITENEFLVNVVRQPENHPRVATVGQTAFFK